MLKLRCAQGTLSQSLSLYIQLTQQQEYTGKTKADFLRDCESEEWKDIVALYRSNESTSVRLVPAISLVREDDKC